MVSFFNLKVKNVYSNFENFIMVIGILVVIAVTAFLVISSYRKIRIWCIKQINYIHWIERKIEFSIQKNNNKFQKRA
jgi:hypothetical protein